jgi:hypothetical protein
VTLTWRRFCWIVFAISLVLAALGVYWYVTAPGVASYQASSLLTLPLFVIALVWLHKRLPIRVQWIVAWPLALVGPIGYAVFGGDQWWNWGQLTPLPLLLLIVTRPGAIDSDGAATGGVVGDGPWGPP